MLENRWTDGDWLPQETRTGYRGSQEATRFMGQTFPKLRNFANIKDFNIREEFELLVLLITWKQNNLYDLRIRHSGMLWRGVM